MYKLHYASLDLGTKNIPCIVFKKHSEMIDFIDEKCLGRNGQVVWLLAKENSSDIFISESHLSIQEFLSKKYLWNVSDNYFLQEYESFEEAYKVALSMQEENTLCYSK